MTQRREHGPARNKLEEATATLLSAATNYRGLPNDSINATQNILRCAREYGRALNRIETMRGRK